MQNCEMLLFSLFHILCNFSSYTEGIEAVVKIEDLLEYLSLSPIS